MSGRKKFCLSGYSTGKKPIYLTDDDFKENVWGLMEEIDTNALNFNYQERKMEELKALGRPAAEVLLEKANDPDQVERLDVAWGLGIIGVHCGVDVLIEYLDEEGVALRETAVDSLGRIKAKEAVEPLLSLLKRAHDDQAQIEVINALGNIGDRKAVEPLLELMDDPNLEVAFVAIRALINIGSERAIEHVIVKLLNENSERTKSHLIKILIGVVDLQGFEIIRKKLRNYVETRSNAKKKDKIKAAHHLYVSILEKKRAQNGRLDKGTLSEGKPKKPDMKKRKMLRVQRTIS